MHQGELMMEKLALIPFMLSMAFAGQSQAALTDGVYETTVNGHNAPMTVKVTIKDHKIAAIDTSKNLESFGVGKVALDKTAAAILKDQTTGVDNITGASLQALPYQVSRLSLLLEPAFRRPALLIKI